MLAWSQQETLYVVIGLVVLAALALGRGLTFSAGKIVARLDSIDKAVNHREEGAPTLSEDVEAIHELLKKMDERLDELEPVVTELGRRVGVLEHPEEGPP